MKKLRKEFTKKGIHFTQVYKDGTIAIYSLTKDNNQEWFEVFRVKVKPADMFHDCEYEAYPSDENFGSWAWSCQDVNSVKKVLGRLALDNVNEISSILSSPEAN